MNTTTTTIQLLLGLEKSASIGCRGKMGVGGGLCRRSRDNWGLGYQTGDALAVIGGIEEGITSSRGYIPEDSSGCGHYSGMFGKLIQKLRWLGRLAVRT